MKLPLLPWLHRVLFRSLPADFRERHGAAIRRTLLRSMGRAGRRGPAALLRRLGRSLLDLAWNALALRLAQAMNLIRKDREMFDTLIHEVRLLLRRLRRSPGFGLVYLLSLGTAVAAATVIFTILRTTVLDPLPYPDSEELVVVWETRAGEDISVSWMNFSDWRERVTTAEMAAYTRTNLNLTGDGPALRVRGLQVTDNLFDMLGVPPVIGRTPEGGGREVLLTHALWAERYGSDPQILGRTILLGGEGWTVVGVAPTGIRFPDGLILGASDLYLPMEPVPEDFLDRDSHPGITGIARLHDGVAGEAFVEELDAVAAQLAVEYPGSNDDKGVRTAGAATLVAGDLRTPLLLLTGAVGLLLLTAIGNVSGLALTRATAREEEWAVRAALGAGREHVVRRALVESGVLGVLAGAVGVGAATLVVSRIPSWRPVTQLGLSGEVTAIDAGVGIAAALVAAFLVALAPTVRSLRSLGALRTRGGGTRTPRTREVLVVGQIALATVLLVSASLLGRSLARIEAENGGLDPSGVSVFSVGLPETEYPDEGSTRVFYDQLREELGALPGVVSVSGISTLPFSGAGAQSGMLPVGSSEEDGVRTDVAVVLPDYFETAGMELLEGRTFGPQDGAGGPVRVVVDERFAARFWPGQSAIGKRVLGWGLQGAEVVGVVGHVKNYGVTRESRQEVFMLHDQRAYLRMWVMVRSEGDREGLAAGIRDAVGRLDGGLPIGGVSRMEDIVADTVSGVRVATGLGSVLTLFTIFLAVIGLRSLIAYGVQLRTREFGIRLALGSERALLRRTVLSQTARLMALGLAGGLLVALAISGTLEGLMFGVRPADPLSYAVAAVAIAAVALLAGDGPARRAARVDPQTALREE